MIFIQGKIKAIGDMISGESAKGSWQKRELTVEMYDGNSICITTFGDAAGKNFCIGDKIAVVCRVSTREYNGRTYNDINSYNIIKE